MQVEGPPFQVEEDQEEKAEEHFQVEQVKHHALLESVRSEKGGFRQRVLSIAP